MNRRDTLGKLILTSGGLIALPTWANGWTIADLTAHHSSFSSAEQDLMASVADSIEDFRFKNYDLIQSAV